MKKLLAILIAVSFCILSAGSVLADEPQINTQDRHSVWTNWFNEDGKRIDLHTSGGMPKNGEATRNVLSQEVMGEGMKPKVNQFDFIRETQYYDYSKDQDASSQS